MRSELKSVIRTYMFQATVQTWRLDSKGLSETFSLRLFYFQLTYNPADTIKHDKGQGWRITSRCNLMKDEGATNEDAVFIKDLA